jgi:hypothetical protein
MPAPRTRSRSLLIASSAEVGGTIYAVATKNVSLVTSLGITLLLTLVASEVEIMFGGGEGRDRGSFTGWVGGLARSGWCHVGELRLGSRLVMRVAAKLMPPAMGERWLGEAESFLFEVAPERRPAVTRSYVRTAPLVIVMAWATALSQAGRRVARSRRASTRARQG